MRSSRWKAGIVAACALALILGGAGYPHYRLARSVRSVESAALPQAEEWTDYGLVIDASPFGEGWDVVFEGGTPAGLVRRGDLYYLYYIGADDYIGDKDNVGPAHRAIGVATSPDGVRWTKYSGNPVVTRPAPGRPEAGAVSAGVYVDDQNTIHLFYGANEPDPAVTHAVHAEVRYATSHDGFTFTDRGVVLRFNDRRVWGAGDELHAQIAWQQNGRWQVYYVPNGVPAGGKLGVAWGRDPLQLGGTAGVLAGFGAVPGGVGSLVPLDDATLALFLTHGSTTQVRLVARETPWLVSAPVRIYTFDSFGNVVFLDQARRTWFMIYDQWSYMGLRLAPAGDDDRSPPTAPDDLVVIFSNDASAHLSWSPSQDPDTGVVAYHVYRDGILLATTLETIYSDGPLAELRAYDYQVRAENFHGTFGPAATRTVTAPADTQAAGIASVAAGGDPFRLEVTFTEPVGRPSAERPANYALTGAVRVSAAALVAGGHTVVLTTDKPMADTMAYTLTVRAVLDRAQTPNPTFAQRTFTYNTAPGLRAYYPLDGDARDLSGGGNHGVGLGPVAWSEGAVDGSLVLDGHTYIELDHTPDLDNTFSGSHTLTAWVRPAALPPDTTASNGAYTVFSGPALRLDYNAAGQFVARLWTTSGEMPFASAPVSPGRWTHVAVVVEAERQLIGLYLDGAPVAGTLIAYSGPLVRLPTPGTGVMAEYLARYRIGIHRPRFDHETNAFAGQLDDVRLYSQALAVEGIAALVRLGDR